MADNSEQLQSKIKHALDECRTVLLGVQMSLGFGTTVVFQRGFQSLPRKTQYAELLALALMLLTFALLAAPASYHRIVEHGEDTAALDKFTGVMLAAALLPFALSLGLGVFIAGDKMIGAFFGVVSGTATTVTALLLWYGIEILMREDRSHKSQEAGLKAKIEHVLTECRMVLPGAQAILGFQFIVIFTEEFTKIDRTLSYVHLSSLFCVLVSAMLLMAPSAYHRIAARGNDTVGVHRFASGMVVAAMAILAVGLAGEFFVILAKVTGSFGLGVVSAAAILLFMYALWFVFTWIKRAKVSS